MRNRVLAALALAFVAAVAGLAPAPLPTRPAAAGDNAVEPPLPTVIPANDEEHKKALDAAAAATAAKDADALAAALAQMVDRRHDDFVAVIRPNVESDDLRVQAAAIVAAATHEMRDVEKSVRKTLHAKPRKGVLPEAMGGVTAACIDYLDRLSIGGEEEFVLKDALPPLIGDERRLKLPSARELIRASVHYLGRMKFKRSVPYLVDDLLAEPRPRDPNDPKNPPASYWETRTKLWHEYEGWARWALREITGQEYRSVREWQAWMKQQDKKAFK